MRVLALTFGDSATASSHYRIFQYVPHFERFGIELHAHPAAAFDEWENVRNYDAVIVQKKLLPVRRVRWLRRHARRLIFDVDDAVWFPHGKPHHWFTRWRGRRRLNAIAQAADLCIVPNQVLGDHLSALNATVALLPMALDGRQWPARSAPDGVGPTIRIGWAGNPVNLCYLEAIEPILTEALKSDPESQFVVFSGERPRFKSLPCEFSPYGPGRESEVIRSFDIGLLPLPENEFANAKSPIKGLQYMASAVPCVASATAATREMFGPDATGFLVRTPAEWATALTRLTRDATLRRTAGERAREEFDRRYEIGRTAEKLAALLATTPA